MEQLLAHLIGDYYLQNDTIGVHKKDKDLKGLIYCLIHCILYIIPFYLLVTKNPHQLLLIMMSHFIIDRWNLIRDFLCIKNGVKYKNNFGCSKDRPFSITVWLFIIHDNIFHLVCNYFIIKYII
jgi:hypothetical protein